MDEKFDESVFVFFFEIVRTTFWTRHDERVQCDEGLAKSSAAAALGEVSEAVVTSAGGGKRLELTLLVTPAVAPDLIGCRHSDAAVRHPSRSNPECASPIDFFCLLSIVGSSNNNNNNNTKFAKRRNAVRRLRNR